MLRDVCEFIHNYFIKASQRGSYEIANGMISLPFVADGQRFLIVGSALNDGLYTYHTNGIKDDDDADVAGLHDETFAGTICALAVPPAVITLSGEIKTWVDKYGDVVNSPYSSEEVIGVYSYSKGSRKGSTDVNNVSWQDVFGNSLNRWRKVSFT